MSKVEIHNHGPNNSKISRNDKKTMCRFYTRTFQKRYYNHRNSFAHKIYRYRTSLSNYAWEIFKNLGTDPILKWEIVKNAVNIKRDKYCNLCMEKKLGIASYNNPNELLNQKLEILNVCRHKKGWLFGR